MSGLEGQQDPSSPKDLEHRPGERGLTSQGEPRGGEHFHLRGGSRPPGRLRQFFHGLSLPFHLARALLADPVARRLYLRVGLLQATAALVLALSCMASGNEAAQGVRREESRAEDEAAAEAAWEVAANVATRYLGESEGRAARSILEERAPPREQGPPSRRRDATVLAPSQGDAGSARLGAEARAALPLLGDAGTLAPREETASLPGEDAIAAAPREGLTEAAASRGEDDSAGANEAARQGAAGARADAGRPARRTRAEARAEAQARLGQRIGELEAAAQGRDGGTSLAEAIAALALEATSSDDVDDEEALDAQDGGTPRDGDRGGPRAKGEDSFWRVKGHSLWSLAFWAALFTMLQVSQWVVIALSRDYHDIIAREASLLTGVAPEDDAIIPRVRLDVPWLRRKVKRRWRALKLFVLGVPAMVVIALPFMCFSGTVMTALSTAWGAWWLVVFTAAKSEHAWAPAPPAQPRPPWFLRAWVWLTTQVPGLRWGVLQRYGAMWTRRTEEVLAPIATVERHPWAFAGLALMRALGALPPMKFFIRPLIPVASAHLLAAEVAERASAIPAAPRPQVPAGETGA